MSSSMSPPRIGRGRLLVGTGAVTVMGWAGFRLATGGIVTSPVDLARWLVGAVLLHDALIGPLACLAGTVLARLLRGPARQVVQAGLAICGVLALLAYPVLRAPAHANRTVLPRDYPVGLAEALGVVLVLTVVAAAVTVARTRHRSRPVG